ncbi:MAG: sugar ABC transporter permease [Phycisphaerales bacterium]|nr:sugar ABC transporter permease [Phycisphaerales bacterium]
MTDAPRSANAARRARAVERAATLRGLLWIGPWLVGFAVFLLYPIVMSLIYSFTDYSILEPPVYVGLENYRDIMTKDATFGRALRNTLVYAAASIPLCTLLSIALALLLERDTRGARAVRAVVFLPTLVPVSAAAIGWMWLLNGDFGLFNAALSAIGLPRPDWLGNPRWAMTSLVIMSLWTVGGATVIYVAALRDVPTTLYEAAAIDGITRLGRAWHITLPLISPAILFNTVIALIGSLQVFAAPYVMTRGGPDFATYFYTMYVYANAFTYARMGYASALAWIQFLLILMITAAFFASVRRRVHYRV